MLNRYGSRSERKVVPPTPDCPSAAAHGVYRRRVDARRHLAYQRWPTPFQRTGSRLPVGRRALWPSLLSRSTLSARTGCWRWTTIACMRRRPWLMSKGLDLSQGLDQKSVRRFDSGDSRALGFAGNKLCDYGVTRRRMKRLWVVLRGRVSRTWRVVAVSCRMRGSVVFQFSKSPVAWTL
jgi:hypothetical protein